MRRIGLLWLCVGLVAGLGACSQDEPSGNGDQGPTICAFDLDCPLPQRCIQGVCGVPDDGNNAPNNDVPNNGVNNDAPNNDPNNDGGCEPSAEVCDGVDNDCDGTIDNDVANACGGCGELEGAPGEACGQCGGAWACDGTSAVRCEGDNVNACGGCGDLGGQRPEQACGQCGQTVCDGADAVRCQESPANACGGCATLTQVPGAECGFCGQVVCDGADAVRCNDPGEAACGVTRLVAMGDTGEGNDTQYAVAVGVQARCDRGGGCDGFVMLGDNIYDEGAQSPTDRQFDQKIDLPYADLKQGPPPELGQADMRPRLPIYVSLGNHDLGGAGLNSFQVANYLEYARSRDWFYYPDEFYDVKVGLVHLMSIHTNPLAYLGSMTDAQGQMVNRVVETTDAPWTLVFGHHPYLSEGRHGNAGSYEGIPGDLVFLGGEFRKWVDQYVCNRADFYLSGHDHNRQWISQVPDIPTWPLFAPNRVPCNTEFGVSGAGAKTTDFENRGNTLDFGAETPGFLYMEFHRDHAVIEFCNASGDTEWSRTVRR